MTDTSVASESLYKMTQRRLVASLMYVGEGAHEVFEIVNPDDMDDPPLQLVLEAMVQLTRRSEPLSAVSVARELEKSGNLGKVGGIAELHALHAEGERYSLDAPVELYAEVLRDASAKARINEHLEEAKKKFTDDSGFSTVDAVSDLQSVLNDQLVGLSNESTVTRVQVNANRYEELLEERNAVSEANKEQADGLQGIPSLLPTLNKYTHGWSPSQMITVGARTGVGKALDINTPILTSEGWKIMENIQIGDKVYGRDGKLTSVTNVTDLQYDRKVYRIHFHNGETIVADADHLWLTKTLDARLNNGDEKVITTTEILETLHVETADGRSVSNHAIELTQPLQNTDGGSWGFNAYEFGKKLAEGDLADFFVKDAQTLDEQVENALTGLLLASESTREQFVNGLLWDNVDGLPYVMFADAVVAEKVRTLFASLGYLTFVNFEEDDNAFQITFYERESFGGTSLLIERVEEIDTVPVKCIEVDNSDHTYLAGEALIPTHNSVFAVNNAVAAARAGKSVLFFTLEMSNEEIDDRIIASMSGVSMSRLKEGNLSDEDRTRVRQALDDLKDMKIMVDSDPRVTVDTIRARAFKQAQSPEGLDLVIVDYLQLITPAGKYSSRQEAVADVSRNMKLTAKVIEVPIIVLVQLNRGKDDEEEGKLPSLENIRESGSIAMDSDVVILLHREDTFDDTTPHTLVILDKNRNGEAHKVIRCHSNLECSLFREVKKEKDTTDERLSDEEYAELEDDIDLDEFNDYDLDDDMDLDL